jgi:hypothetical protein
MTEMLHHQRPVGDQLLSGGYAPVYAESSLDSAHMSACGQFEPDVEVPGQADSARDEELPA